MLECTDLNGKWQSEKPETIKNQDETTMYVVREPHLMMIVGR